MTVPPTTKARPGARERLLASANELFYLEGVQSVGIDRIIEHAGVAKASLYNTFGSKEELVRAYLEHRHEDTAARITAAVEAHDVPRDRILAVFDSQAKAMRRPDYRGCAFAAASAEAKPGGCIEASTRSYRSWLRDLFTGWPPTPVPVTRSCSLASCSCSTTVPPRRATSTTTPTRRPRPAPRWRACSTLRCPPRGARRAAR